MALTRPRALQLFDIDYKQAVRVITQTNITLSGGAPDTVDGISLAVEDRVLVAGQGTGSQNGIYVVTTLGSGSNGTWTRSTDTNTTGSLQAGATVMVTEGGVYADTQWKLTTNNPITIGSTALVWEQNSAFAFGNIYANGTAVLANVVGDVLTVDPGTNITITGNATAKSVTISVIDSPQFSGTLNVTGNANVGNLGTAGLIVATGNITGGNLTTAGLTSTATLSASGNANVGNLGTAGLIVATGNVTGGNVNTAGQVVATGNITGGNLTTVGLTSTATLTSSGNANVGNLGTAGLIVATGNITGGNIITSGELFGGTLRTTGNALINGNLTVQGNLTYINIDDLRVEDPVIILGTGPDGSPLTSNDGLDRGVYLEYYTTDTGNAFVGWQNATGNMIIASDVSFASNDVIQVNSYGTLQAGNAYVESINVVGNVTGGNINTAGQVVATGNITGGNLTTAGLTSTSTLSASGNANVGNLGTAGLIVATGNITGGNLTTAGLTSTATLSASGNANVGNLGTAGLIVATGNITGGNVISSGLISAATTIDATGNITGGNLTTAGLTSTATLISSGNANVGNLGTAGLIVATGNVTGGNINTAGQVVATGNITGGNVTTAGLTSTGTLTATGNITGGNVNTAGLVGAGAITSSTTVVATGNITGGNLTTAGLTSTATLTASGNITGGNVNTAGLVDAGAVTSSTTVVATGNVTGGNINTAGQVVATGNITGGNLSGTSIVGTLTTAAQPNITSVGTLTDLDVAGNVISNTGTFGNITISDSNINSDAGSITINSDSNDVDFRVNGDTNANIFYIDAGAETVSIGSGTQTTGATLAINSSDSILLPIGNTTQRPSGAVGMARYNTETTSFEIYKASGWSAVGADFTVIASEVFAGDNSTVAFTLATSQTTDSCIVAVNGIMQAPTSAYSVSDTTLTFTEAPLDGDIIEVRELTTTTTVAGISNSIGNAIITTTDTSNDIKVTGNFVPTANLTYTLGNATNNWESIYVGGNTIYLGNVVVKDDGGSIAFFEPDGTTPTTLSGASVNEITSGTSSLSFSHVDGPVLTNVGGVTIATTHDAGFTVDGDLNVTGNATLSGNILGDRIQNGTTTIDIQSASGNANISIGGTNNVGVFYTGGLNVTGAVGATTTITATGNITGGNLSGTSIVGTLTTASQTNITGVGTISTGTWAATDVAVAYGGTGASNAPNARTNLGLAIGTNVQAYDSDLAAIATNSTNGIYARTGTGTVSARTITASTGVSVSNGDGVLGNPTISIGQAIGSGDSPTFAGLTIPTITKNGTSGVGNIGQSDNTFNTVFAKATSALYADLAEKYLSDADYEPGTVVIFGGTAEVTLSESDADHRVAGVVSTSPAYIMNSGLEGTHTAMVALTGRVPCKVIGPVAKGDLMVSAENGHARSDNSATAGRIIGKALEDFAGDAGVIEVVIGKH